METVNKRPRLLYSLKEVLEMIPLSTSGLYKMVNDPNIIPESAQIRLGKRIFIKKSWIEENIGILGQGGEK